MSHKVLLAEDYGIVTTRVGQIFDSVFRDYELEVVKSHIDIVDSLKKNDFRLVILDLHPRAGNSLQVIKDILSIYSNLPIIVFSGYTEELYARHLYHGGIKGYLGKHIHDEEIIAAIRQVLDGKTYISENYKNFLLFKTLSQADFNDSLATLSAREMEVSILLTQGMLSIEICQELNLQPSTVSTYKTSIFDKLNVTNVLELKQLMDNYRQQ